MGRTIASYIKKFPKECVAQLFLHEGNPNSNLCDNYYKFTDIDALKSILFRWHRGEVLRAVDSASLKASLQNGRVYHLGRKRKPLVSIAREMVWKFSNAFNKKLKSWLKAFNPDIVFFACSDYKYSYSLTRKITNYLHKPLVLCCFDDFYIHCHYLNQFLGKFYYKCYMKEVHKTFREAKLTFAFNEEMAEAYAGLFKWKFPILYTASDSFADEVAFDEKKGISYLGGLGYDRDKQLVALGKALKCLHVDGIPKYIDVYSPENRPDILRNLTIENGIVFHGAVSHDKVTRIISCSQAIIHVESFDKAMSERTKYSLSTKIAESLASGTLLIAFGPKEVASIKYLARHESAIVSDNIDDLISKLSVAIRNPDRYNEIVKKAKQLYFLNHTTESVSKVFLSEISKAIDTFC